MKPETIGYDINWWHASFPTPAYLQYCLLCEQTYLPIRKWWKWKSNTAFMKYVHKHFIDTVYTLPLDINLPGSLCKIKKIIKTTQNMPYVKVCPSLLVMSVWLCISVWVRQPNFEVKDFLNIIISSNKYPSETVTMVCLHLREENLQALESVLSPVQADKKP